MVPTKPSSVPMWRQVAMPSEHGGWSLTVEPVLLGLLVAPSLAGVALGLAAVGAFVARTPLKVVLVDRWRGRWLERTGLAARIAAAEAVAIVALGVAASLGSASRWFWLPLVGAAPLIGVELWYDMRSRSRRLLPELAGTVGIGSVAAAIALAGGESAELATGLWVVVAARAGAAIPLVRVQLDRTHGRSIVAWPSDLAQILAVVAVGGAWLAGWIPLGAVAAVLAVAAYGVISLRLTPRPATVIGAQQVVVGLVVVAATAVSVRLG